MSATAMRRGPGVRRAYRREIRDALDMGVTPENVAVVVDAFRGEHPDPDEFRTALAQYVPATALFMGEEPYQP